VRRALILGVALLLASATVAQAGTVPKVSGTYTYEYGGGVSTITIDARASDPAGGTFSFARDDGVYLAGPVVCVVIDGQDAWVVGVITSTPETDFWMGRVYDSGLRGGIGDAAISFAGPGDPPPGCKFPLQWNLTEKWMVPITSGNILIH
jgi:hypothetical protein